MPRIGAATMAVFFDIGETILDRTAEYRGWAEFLDVPAHTFSAVFGAVISRGGGVADVLATFRPDGPVSTLTEQAEASGLLPAVAESDLYPDVRPVLARLHEVGLFVGVVGNQRAAMGPQLRALGLPADLVAVSEEWGAAKPAPGFFEEIVARSGRPRESILYVGDQLDNDVVAARRAGLASVRVLTGPWGRLQRDEQIEAECLAVIPSLSGLLPLLTDDDQPG